MTIPSYPNWPKVISPSQLLPPLPSPPLPSPPITLTTPPSPPLSSPPPYHGELEDVCHFAVHLHCLWSLFPAVWHVVHLPQHLLHQLSWTPHLVLRGGEEGEREEREKGKRRVEERGKMCHSVGKNCSLVACNKVDGHQD